VAKQDDLYQEVAAMYGSALERLARVYETDADRVRDLLQVMPGLILICLAPAVARPETAWRALGLYVGIMVFFWLIVEANRYAANRLQARIDALERDT
jgi:hypothetical protein